ncbi:hypothetical protein PMIN06_012662 [Paraphaeosphaeria minitans]
MSERETTIPQGICDLGHRCKRLRSSLAPRKAIPRELSLPTATEQQVDPLKTWGYEWRMGEFEAQCGGGSDAVGGVWRYARVKCIRAGTVPSNEEGIENAKVGFCYCTMGIFGCDT